MSLFTHISKKLLVFLAIVYFAGRDFLLEGLNSTFKNSSVVSIIIGLFKLMFRGFWIGIKNLFSGMWIRFGDVWSNIVDKNYGSLLQNISIVILAVVAIYFLIDALMSVVFVNYNTVALKAIISVIMLVIIALIFKNSAMLIAGQQTYINGGVM